jgi:hypothetical protein
MKRFECTMHAVTELVRDSYAASFRAYPGSQLPG